jgi:hypothetical protein
VGERGCGARARGRAERDAAYCARPVRMSRGWTASSAAADQSASLRSRSMRWPGQSRGTREPHPFDRLARVGRRYLAARGCNLLGDTAGWRDSEPHGGREMSNRILCDSRDRNPCRPFERKGRNAPIEILVDFFRCSSEKAKGFNKWSEKVDKDSDRFRSRIRSHRRHKEK